MDNKKCFAYKSEKKCIALIDNSKCGINCPFRKTNEDLETGRAKANERLAALPNELQLYIAYTYYNGKRLWLKTQQRAGV